MFRILREAFRGVTVCGDTEPVTKCSGVFFLLGWLGSAAALIYVAQSSVNDDYHKAFLNTMAALVLIGPLITELFWAKQVLFSQGDSRGFLCGFCCCVIVPIVTFVPVGVKASDDIDVSDTSAGVCMCACTACTLTLRAPLVGLWLLDSLSGTSFCSFSCFQPKGISRDYSKRRIWCDWRSRVYRSLALRYSCWDPLCQRLTVQTHTL